MTPQQLLAVSKSQASNLFRPPRAGGAQPLPGKKGGHLKGSFASQTSSNPYLQSVLSKKQMSRNGS